MTILDSSSHPADVLRMAIAREEESIKFYQDAVRIITDPGTKKMLEELIKEEKEHKKVLEDELSRGVYTEN